MSIMRSRLTLIVAFVLVIFLSFGSMAFGLEGDYGSIISPTAFADETPDIFDTDINVDEIGENSEAMTLIDKIRNAANVFAAIVLAISIIMIIIGALQYFLFSCDPVKSQQAKMVLFFSGVYLVINYRS